MNTRLRSLNLQKMLRGSMLLTTLAFAGQASGQTVTSISKNLVSANEVITVNGTGLGAIVQVLLDGQPMAKIAGPTGNTLNVTVPVGASSGYLRFVTQSGSMLLFPLRIRVQRASSSVTAAANTTVSMPAMGTFNTPYATDLDADGLIDLLIGDNNGNINDYEQTRVGGSFGSPVALKSNGAPLDVRDYAKPTVTDVDGDGLLDLLVGTGQGRRIVRYEQLGNGYQPNEFGPGTNLTTDGQNAIEIAYNFPRPTATDLNGNGRIDLLVGDDSGRIAFYEQKAAVGTQSVQFELKTSELKLSNGTSIDVGGTSKPTVLDWDGNGLLDMLVGSSDGKVYRYEQSAANAVTFTYKGQMLTSTGGNAIDAGTYSAPTVTDMDNDGQMDLILGNDSGTLQRFEQGIAAPVTPLPVVLSAFVGEAATQGNQLSWATAQEINSARFVVEASATGSSFAPIASIDAAGTSTSLTTYLYLDASDVALAAGRRYYRLRQEDFDGKVSYSPVISVARTAAPGSKQLVAYPNPFSNQLLVALPGRAEAETASFTLSTLAGRTVHAGQLELGAAPRALPDLPELPAGIYLLRLRTADGVAMQKIVRQ